MLLSEEQEKLLEAAEVGGGGNSEGQDNALIAKDYRWPNGIVRYQFDPALTYEEKTLINGTLTTLEEKLGGSCIRFVESNSSNRVFVTNDGYSDGSSSGCSSYVGYQNRTTQKLILLSCCCMNPGIIQHEFLHAMGIYHTQVRQFL